MKIEHYINEINKPKEKKQQLLSLRDIDSFKEIPEDKKELVKSVTPHLLRETFVNGLELYNDYRTPAQEYGYFQTRDVDGVRGLKSILYRWEGKYSFDPYEVLSEEDFSNQYNNIEKVGSQDYARLTLSRKIYDEYENYSIFYTLDGNVFISDGTAFFIKVTKMDELGTKLAYAIKYNNTNNKKRNEDIRKNLVKNYRHIR